MQRPNRFSASQTMGRDDCSLSPNLAREITSRLARKSAEREWRAEICNNKAVVD